MSDPFAQSRQDVLSLIATPVQAGIVYANGGNYASAVTTFQQAGQAGADQVGPEIDAAGFPEATQKFTQEAWQVNQTLSQIASTGATQGNAESAQLLAQKILELYQRAMDAGTEASQFNVWPWVLGLAGVGIVGGIALGLRSSRKPSTSRAPTRRVSSRKTRRLSQARTRRAA